MNELQKTLENAIRRIDDNTNLFYQNKFEIAYKELDKTLQIIGDVINEIKKIDRFSDIEYNIENKFVEILYNAMKALEDHDGLLLSDILHYELKEILCEVRDSLI